MHKIFLPILIVTLFINCKKDKPLNIQQIIDKSIEISGGNEIENSTINFNFRDKQYKAIRNNGQFQFERLFKDSTNVIRDVLSNNGFQRYINNELLKVSDSMIPKYSASVNSVHYFSVLPFGLNDAAVNKQYLEDVDINNSKYHKIKITFNQEDGGEDFEDVFIYWINTETFKTEYLAYSYNESDGVGLRFREAYNERYIYGVRFVDYKNYKPKEKDTKTTLLNLDSLFENNELQLLSKIELKNIVVN